MFGPRASASLPFSDSSSRSDLFITLYDTLSSVVLSSTRAGADQLLGLVLVSKCHQHAEEDLNTD